MSLVTPGQALHQGLSEPDVGSLVFIMCGAALLFAQEPGVDEGMPRIAGSRSDHFDPRRDR